MRRLMVFFFATSTVTCGGFDCPSKCEKIKSEIVRVLQSKGETPDENTVCNKDSFENAKDCNECKSALLNEYGIAPVHDSRFCD